MSKTENPKEFKQIVRMHGADIDGKKQIYHALKRIKGVSDSFSNAVCKIAKLKKSEQIGNLSDEQLKKIEEILKNPEKYKIPKWLFNRRKDYDTAEDKHIISVEIKLRKDFDIKRMKKIKSYRGMRHAFKLPVRGQRTKSNFRKGTKVGVLKKTKKGKK